MLPSTEEIGGSFAWDKEDIESLLVGSPLMKESLSLRERVEEGFDALQDTLAANPEIFPPDICNRETYLWAFAILFSRSARVNYDTEQPDVTKRAEDTILLVPYIDLINHNPSSRAYIEGAWVGVSLPLGLSEKRRVVQIRADRYYDKYEQIFLSYGPKSNAQLLLQYGFCLERNVQDFLELDLSGLLANASMSGAKQRYIEERKMNNKFPFYRDRFTYEMWEYMRLIMTEPENLPMEAESEDEIVEALSALDFRRPITEAVERRALTSVQDLCKDMLAAYPTSMDEDEQLFQDRMMFDLLPRNHRNALRVRFGEKVILSTSIVSIDTMIANVGVTTKKRDYKDSLKIESLDDVKLITNLEELMDQFDL